MKKKVFVKRGRLEIIYEILSVARRPVQKTRILYSCNLSFEQLQKYLKYLEENKLLETVTNEDKNFYVATGKGKEFIEGYEHINGFLEQKCDAYTVARNSYSQGILHNYKVP